MKSILTKSQKRQETFKNLTYQGEQVNLTVNLRYDDECGNGHNTFSITGDLYRYGRPKTDGNMITCGRIHDIIAELAPQYKHLIKWHLMSSDEPVHYVANTLYHAKSITKYTNFVYLKDVEFKFDVLLGIYKEEDIIFLQVKYGKENIRIKSEPHYSNKESDFDAARRSAIAPNATRKQLQDKQWLIDRLPTLVEEFKNTMEGLGFIY